MVTPRSTRYVTVKIIIILLVQINLYETQNFYTIDDSSELGKRFSGIGAVSGGGATSKLLINYNETYRDQILDYLFKPDFGASLDILKVEIGGDGQSSEGVEASHMHTWFEENYQRGYEWWLMKEANQRNPDITLVGLAWSFPGWLSNGIVNSPFIFPIRTASYIANWVHGAKKHHGLNVNYVGIWNEHQADPSYIKVLRATLDSEGLHHVKIIAGDLHWEIAQQMLNDSKLLEAVDIIGAHYPGTVSSKDAVLTNKSLWSSEDYSTFNDNVGAGCWARIMNQNYVNGQMSTTIAWNLIASYYDSLSWTGMGLMTANQPWSGYYSVKSPIWMTAHTTQFTNPGWYYLMHGQGVGLLQQGGSYVSLMDPETNDLTIIIETMTHNHSECIRPALPPYNVSKQNATFILKGSFTGISELKMWFSKLEFGKDKTTLFKELDPVKVINNTITLFLDVDIVITLTTVSTGHHGSQPEPPASASFPVPYSDDFESYNIDEEPYNFAQQSGVWEVHRCKGDRKGHVIRQVLTTEPIHWCGSVVKPPITIIGDPKWSDISAKVDVYFPATGANGIFLALRVSGEMGCNTMKAGGVFFWIFPDLKQYLVTGDLASTKLIGGGTIEHISREMWHTLDVSVKGNKFSALVDQKLVIGTVLPPDILHGFVAIGTNKFGLADFDNFQIKKSEIHMFEYESGDNSGIRL